MKILLTGAVSLIFFASVSYAQFDILGKVKQKVEEKVEEETDEAIDNTVDETADEIKGENEEEEETSSEEVNEDEPAGTEPTAEKKASLKSYSKYDFIPGTNLLFYDDFSMDPVGDFPVKWNTNGSGEVVTLNTLEGKWFRLINAVSYTPYIEMETFGENYTVEINFLYDVPESEGYGYLYVDFYHGDDIDEVPSASSGPYAPGVQFEFIAEKDYISRFGAAAFYNTEDDIQSGTHNTTESKGFIDGEVNRLSFSFNKQRFRVYLNEKKVMDLPKLVKAGTVMNRLNIRTWYWNDNEENNILIKDVRIAEGQPDTRNELITKGRLVTHGILFDVNSDQIKPESYGTIKDIAKVLSENQSVKVKILGHTDSDGEDDSNLDLSKRRAVSVKNALESEFGIDASRIETDGKGESEPVSDNNSPEGKAKNRRVEFIKL